MHELLLDPISHRNQVLDKQALANEILIERILEAATGKQSVHECHRFIAREPLPAMGRERGYEVLQCLLDKLCLLVEVQRLCQARVDRSRIQLEHLGDSVEAAW